MMIDKDKVDELVANQPLNFSDALYLMKIGEKMKRRAWKDTLFIKIKKPTYANDGSTREPTFVGDVNGVPMENADFKSEDLLAEDWVIVK